MSRTFLENSFIPQLTTMDFMKAPVENLENTRKHRSQAMNHGIPSLWEGEGCKQG